MARAIQVDFLIGGVTNSSGQPLAGGKIYTYEAGTTTNKATYTDADATTPATNPIILDGQGKATIFASGEYKFKIDDSDDVTQYTIDGLKYELLTDEDIYGGTSTGAANTYAITVTSAITAYVAGQVYRFISHQANTSTTPTLNVNGLGAKTLKRSDGTALISGDIQNGQQITAMYNGTDMLITSDIVSYIEPVATESTTLLSEASNAWTSALSDSITLTATQGILILAVANVSNAGASSNCEVRLTRDGSQIGYAYKSEEAGTSTSGDHAVCTIPYYEEPGAGTYSYAIEFREGVGSSNTAYIRNKQLILIPIRQR